MLPAEAASGASRLLGSNLKWPVGEDRVQANVASQKKTPRMQKHGIELNANGEWHKKFKH
jgi:hypothetical protein